MSYMTSDWYRKTIARIQLSQMCAMDQAAIDRLARERMVELLRQKALNGEVCYEKN